jgi:hypothetical protein
VRYDPHEKTHGQPLPHLFARRVGTRHEVISLFAVRTLLDATADSASPTTAARAVYPTRTYRLHRPQARRTDRRRDRPPVHLRLVGQQLSPPGWIGD